MDTDPAEMLRPFIDRLRELGYRDEIAVTFWIHDLTPLAPEPYGGIHLVVGPTNEPKEYISGTWEEIEARIRELVAGAPLRDCTPVLPFPEESTVPPF